MSLSRKTLVARIRENRLAPAIRDGERIYEAGISSIQSHQLAKFNWLWATIQQNVPYYQKLVQDGIVPTEIHDWADFAQFPVLTRASIQDDATQYIDPSGKIAGWSTTGGSTGTPFRVPYWSSEKQALMPSVWLGRGFYGIQVSDRLFQFWGHSHLFGSGWERHVKQIKRMIKNRLLGYQTFSAYHLTPQRLRQVGEAIIRMRPDYIIGYSRSLTLLAKENADQAEAFRQLPIKAIIATTEAFNGPNDAKLLEQVFGCPVGMEYGAAETGVIAYTHPSDQRYRAFWDIYLLEAVPVNETDAKLLLTALYPRAMPLIRYDIGDSVRNYDSVENSIVSFDMILGRDNDLIDIGDGAFVHPVALIHCVQSQEGVLGVQVVQEKDNSVSISIMCETPLPKNQEAAMRRNLLTLDDQLSKCKINYVDHLEQTIAGKTKWVVKR